MDIGISIVDLERTAIDGVVTKVYWAATATKDGKSVQISGTSHLTIKEYPSEQFIPFEDLTEDIVLYWIDKTDGELINELLEKKIADTFYPPFLEGIPWEESLELV